MKHIHKKTGIEYEVGSLVDFNGMSYDMCIITKWSDDEDDLEGPVIVGYYFGPYDDKLTDTYIDDYLKNR